jgi:lysophospholipase L1-like esterase
MNHFPSINAISASICLLGCGLALPVFSQQPEKGKPDAAHISKTKADWWSQRHALLKQTLAETPCQLLFIGDSITHRWETDGKKIWSQYFSPYAPVNFGIGGDRTEHVLWRIDDSALKTPHSPQVCVIMVGTNNTGQYKGRQTPQETAERGVTVSALRSSPEQFAAKKQFSAPLQAALLHLLCTVGAGPATEIILLHIFPRGKTAEDPLRIQNEMINRELDKTNMPRVHVVNINSAFLDKDGTFLPGITGDLVHLTEKGYRLWADALLPEIKKYMK